MLFAFVAPAQATFPGANGRIVFASDRVGGAYQLFTMRPDGSRLRQLTHSPDTLAVFPDWSPDGQKIAFEGDSADGTADSELFLVPSAGGHVVQLTHNTGLDADPAWSPDGKSLAYCHAASANGAPDIYLINADGTDIHSLTSNPANDCEPQWSPNGRWIAFASDRRGPGRSAIFKIRATGGRPQQITPTRLDAGDPDWAPSGDRLAFESHVSSAHSSLYTIAASGTGLRRLTHGPTTENDLFPSYSPNGRLITFFSDRTGQEHIWVMRTDGERPRDLTPLSQAINFAPDWGARRDG
jgi:TolB protein